MKAEPIFEPEDFGRILPDHCAFMVYSPFIASWVKGSGERLYKIWQGIRASRPSSCLFPSNDPRSRRGPGLRWKEGNIGLEYYASGFLIVKFNPLRAVHSRLLQEGKLRAGPVAPADRHGNSILQDQLVGMTWDQLRDMVFAEVLRVRDWAEERFEKLIADFGEFCGPLSVEVYWYALQLACDVEVKDTGEVVQAFYPFFERNFLYVQKESKDPETPHFIAGRTRKYPRLVLYEKVGLVRAEIEVDPTRIKQAVGSHRVAFSLEKLKEQLQAVWIRHAVPLLRELERDRCVDSWTPDVIRLLTTCPGFKDRRPLESALVDMAQRGWVQVHDANRNVVKFLRAEGLVVGCSVPGRYKLAPGLDLSGWSSHERTEVIVDSPPGSRLKVTDIGVLGEQAWELAENAD